VPLAFLCSGGHIRVALQHYWEETLMTKLVASLRKTEKGATAVEYGVLIALIIAVLIVTIGLIGGELLSAFQSVLTQLQA
jgi:pilus assembly protein Flp/PilA